MSQFVIDGVGEITGHVGRKYDEIAVLPSLVVTGNLDLLTVVFRGQLTNERIVTDKKHLDGQIRKLNFFEGHRGADQLPETFQLRKKVQLPDLPIEVLLI